MVKGRKRDSSPAAAVWECGKLALFCELSKAVREEWERAFLFHSFLAAVISTPSSLLYSNLRLHALLIAVELSQREGSEIDRPITLVDHLQANALFA